MSRGKILLAVAFVVLVVFSLGLFFTNRNEKTPKYRTEPVQRGEVVASVTATGTLSAVTTVNVGSQVSGIIAKLYADFNSKVTKGQLLAELDPTNFEAQMDQRRADLEKAKVEQRNMKVAYERSKNLLANELIARSEYDTAEANLLSAAAAVKQAEAAVRQAQTNLTNTKIYSPINGVVVDRQVDIGQTVAASFQAPTLFTLAQDLTQMRVSTNIDEADIGKVRTGIEANFTVDAFPERTYLGSISQIRLSPQTVQNVVTYPVLIDVQNPKLELKPGMTANVTIPYKKEENVLKIPNAALRFRPETQETTGGNARPPRRREGSQVYVLNEKGELQAVSVRTSITDGNYTAIEGLKEGDRVVAGLQTTRGMQSTGGIAATPRRR